MSGQAYVTVQAQATTYSATTAGSGGAVSGSYIIEWTFAGGISGEGWTIPGNDKFPPITIIPVPDNVEATNAAVSSALNGQKTYYTTVILNQWYCGTTAM